MHAKQWCHLVPYRKKHGRTITNLPIYEGLKMPLKTARFNGALVHTNFQLQITFLEPPARIWQFFEHPV